MVIYVLNIGFIMACFDRAMKASYDKYVPGYSKNSKNESHKNEENKAIKGVL